MGVQRRERAVPAPATSTRPNQALLPYLLSPISSRSTLVAPAGRHQGLRSLRFNMSALARGSQSHRRYPVLDRPYDRMFRSAGLRPYPVMHWASSCSARLAMVPLRERTSDRSSWRSRIGPRASRPPARRRHIRCRAAAFDTAGVILATSFASRDVPAGVRSPLPKNDGPLLDPGLNSTSMPAAADGEPRPTEAARRTLPRAADLIRAGR